MLAPLRLTRHVSRNRPSVLSGLAKPVIFQRFTPAGKRRLVRRPVALVVIWQCVASIPVATFLAAYRISDYVRIAAFSCADALRLTGISLFRICHGLGPRLAITRRLNPY